jgi:uncharacterized small protein (DUF1192 family)
METDDLPRPKSQLTAGEVLDSVSIAELELRVAAFEAEIARLKAEIERKKASKTVADAFFKS